MEQKEIQKVLDEFNSVRPEMLNGEAKRLFNAIMKIADERDELKKIEEAHRELNGQLRKELQLKDKMIDLMAHQINEGNMSDMFCEEKTACDEDCDKCIKEYFTKKASENNE